MRTGSLRLVAFLVVLSAFGSPEAFAQRRRPVRRPAKQAPAKQAAPAKAPAPTQPPTVSEAQVQRAREHYERARTLFTAGEFNDALTNFLAAYEARPHPIVYLSIAECYERLDDFHHAVDYLDRYLRELPDARDREQVQARMNGHRSRPSKIRVISDPSGGLIVVDSRETNQRTPSEIELTPGAHRIGVRKDGFRESSMEVQLGFAERRDLNVSLESASAMPPPAAATSRPTDDLPDLEPEPATPTDTETGGVSGVAYLTGGLAVVGLVGGSVLGVLALGDKSAFESTPTAEIADRGERWAFWADVSFGVAAAAGLTTIVLIALGGGSSTESATPGTSSLRLLPVAGASGAGLVAMGRF